MSTQFEQLINEKLEVLRTNLITEFNQKSIQTQELTKLTLKLQSSSDGSSSIPLNEFLIKFNRFLSVNTETTQQINSQFSSFLRQESRYFFFYVFSSAKKILVALLLNIN